MRFFSLLQSILLAAALSASTAGAAGLEVTTTNEVACKRKTVEGDTVQMHYRGRLQDTGKEFDASYNRGTPLSFKLGAGRVIKGWDQGLLGMCVGEKRTLTIPPELAYGNRAMGPIPAGSTLVFDTELMGIDGVSKDEL